MDPIEKPEEPTIKAFAVEDNVDTRELLDVLAEIGSAEVDPEYLRRQENLRRVEQSKLRILEAIHQDRGLRFDLGGWGCAPVQIYGEIDGLRFYWRVRYNSSSILIGPYNKALEEALEKADDAERAYRLAEHQAECEEDTCFKCSILSSPSGAYNKGIEHYYPTQVFASAVVEPAGSPEDTYKGNLELDEVVPVFERLLKSLEYKDPEDQVDVWVLEMLDREPGDTPLLRAILKLSEEDGKKLIEAEKVRLFKKYRGLLEKTTEG